MINATLEGFAPVHYYVRDSSHSLQPIIGATPRDAIRTAKRFTGKRHGALLVRVGNGPIKCERGF
jgi:hypothetical protein